MDFNSSGDSETTEATQLSDGTEIKTERYFETIDVKAETEYVTECDKSSKDYGSTNDYGSTTHMCHSAEMKTDRYSETVDVKAEKECNTKTKCVTKCDKSSKDCGSNNEYGYTNDYGSSSTNHHVSTSTKDCVSSNEYGATKLASQKDDGVTEHKPRVKNVKVECTEVCVVCEDMAAGFHCGAFVCEACKKFFLRMETSAVKRAKVQHCDQGWRCIVTKSTRTHCQPCRLRKCYLVGLRVQQKGLPVKPQIRIIPCRVCGAPSSGFHFGAITCEGCKGFFRRMRLVEKRPCLKMGQCDVTMATRNACKGCRYEKCVSVGMTAHGSRIGRQTNALKHATLLEVQRCGGSITKSEEKSLLEVQNCGVVISKSEQRCPSSHIESDRNTLNVGSLDVCGLVGKVTEVSAVKVEQNYGGSETQFTTAETEIEFGDSWDDTMFGVGDRSKHDTFDDTVTRDTFGDNMKIEHDLKVSKSDANNLVDNYRSYDTAKRTDTKKVGMGLKVPTSDANNLGDKSCGHMKIMASCGEIDNVSTNAVKCEHLTVGLSGLCPVACGHESRGCEILKSASTECHHYVKNKHKSSKKSHKKQRHKSGHKSDQCPNEYDRLYRYVDWAVTKEFSGGNPSADVGINIHGNDNIKDNHICMLSPGGVTSSLKNTSQSIMKSSEMCVLSSSDRMSSINDVSKTSREATYTCMSSGISSCRDACKYTRKTSEICLSSPSGSMSSVIDASKPTTKPTDTCVSLALSGMDSPSDARPFTRKATYTKSCMSSPIGRMGHVSDESFQKASQSSISHEVTDDRGRGGDSIYVGKCKKLECEHCRLSRVSGAERCVELGGSGLPVACGDYGVSDAVVVSSVPVLQSLGYEYLSHGSSSKQDINDFSTVSTGVEKMPSLITVTTVWASRCEVGALHTSQLILTGSNNLGNSTNQMSYHAPYMSSHMPCTINVPHISNTVNISNRPRISNTHTLSSMSYRVGWGTMGLWGTMGFFHVTCIIVILCTFNDYISY